MNWNTKENSELVKALLSLRSVNQAQRFLRDLMTEKEITEFAKRFKAANMLSKNIAYTEIVKQTGLSSTTVARVAKWLKGRGQGYASVITQMHHQPLSRTRKDLS